MDCLYAMYLTDTAYRYFKGALAAIHYFETVTAISFFKGIELIRNSSCSHPSMNSKIKEQMQTNILSSLLFFC